MSRLLPDGDRRSQSKILTENTLRWFSNILIEVMANHIGPCFSSQVREQTQLVIREIHKLQDLITEE